MCSAASVIALFAATVYFKFYNVYFYGALWAANGLLQSCGWPSVVAVMGNWFGHSSRGFVLGAWSACASIGNILGAAIAAQVTGYGYVPAHDLAACSSPFAGLVRLSSHPTRSQDRRMAYQEV